MMIILVRIFRRLIRLLVTQRTSISAPEKLIRGLLLVPIFGTLLVLLRLRAMVFGPLRVNAITADGHRFNCHLPDLIQMYLYLFGVWEPDVAACIRSRLKPGDVFVDVGANIGFDTLIASRAVTETGRVVAIEASPSVFLRLLETLRINGHPSNVRTKNHAAAAERGELKIYSGPQHNVGLTTTVQREGMRLETSVPAAPLDELLTDEEIARTRLIKIDVEGGEVAVLAGIRRLLADGRTDLELLIELSPNWWSDKFRRPLDVLQPFLDAGFHVFELPNNYWPWRYLWPNDITTQRVDRLDVLLSRSKST